MGDLILIADDDAQVRRAIRRMLSSHPFEIIEAANGREAIRMCREHSEELLVALVDVLMPVLDGHGFAEALESIEAGFPVLFISGNATDAPQGHRLLPKPFGKRELLAAIAQVTDGDASEG